MSLNLSDDLRHAVEAEGTPLKLVDPQTGEIYVLIRESAFASAQSLLARDVAALRNAQIPSARLLEIAHRNRPPQEWLEGEEEQLF
jgi:hypothetical protein